MMFRKRKKVFIAAIGTVFVGLLVCAHFLYRNVTAQDLYYWKLQPPHQAVNVYPGWFTVDFFKPIDLSVGSSPTVTLASNINHLYVSRSGIEILGNQFRFNVANTDGGELPIAGTEYQIYFGGDNLVDGASWDYYEASGWYWGSGFTEFMNVWRVTFANPFPGYTFFSTPTHTATFDFADFATTVRTGYYGVNLGASNGVWNVYLKTCGGQAVLGNFGRDRGTISFPWSEVSFEINSLELASMIGTYDASTSGANRCVRLEFPPGYHSLLGIGGQSQFVEYNLRYLAHERMAANSSVVQPNQLFSVDFNQQIALSATTTAARLYDITAGTYVASIPLTTSANAYVGNGVTSDGMTNDTLYLDFASAYSLQAGKSYRIEIPGIAVRKLNSWDYVRYNIDGSDYTFTVAHDNDAPQVLSFTPSGTTVATSTTSIVLTYDEPVTLSSGTATFEIWTNTAATSTVPSVSNVYESVSGDEYTIDLQGIIDDVFSTTTLSENTTYWIRVSANAVIDDEANAMDAPYILTFKTVVTPVIDPGLTDPDEDEGEIGVDVEENTTPRGPSGRRSRPSSGESSSNTQNQNQGGIAPATSFGRLTDPVDENLLFGDVGDAVYRLQKALNRIGFYVAEEGPGSPGQETGVFATSTRDAVTRFQINAGIVPAVGVFGPITRALLGFILNW